MKTLENAIRCYKTTAALLELNQKSFIRDDKFLTPTGVNWDLEKHSEMFGRLMNLRDDINNIIESLNQL
jgi:hypothetical protein